MGIKLRTVDDFAEEVGGKAVAKQMLSDRGIRVISGFFDDRRLQAAFSEPRWLRDRRKGWSLSHTSGLGAVKHWMDPLKINIVEHECRGSQWLMLQGPSGSRNFVKMYYKGRLSARGTAARFEIRNFLRENAPTHFLCTSFEGPHLWAITTKELTKRWHDLQKAKQFAIDSNGFSIPYGGEDHPGGFLGITFHVDKGKHILDNPTKIGIR